MKLIEHAIYQMLKHLANGNVHPLRAPDNHADDFIIFQRIDGERTRSISGPTNLADVRIQIDCYSKSYYTAKGMAVEAEAALDGFQGAVVVNEDTSESVRIWSVSLQNEADSVEQTEEPVLYRNISTYLITYEKE